jgi:hypothetical protein
MRTSQKDDTIVFPFQVLVVVTMENTVFLDVKLYSLVKATNISEECTASIFRTAE